MVKIKNLIIILTLVLLSCGEPTKENKNDANAPFDTLELDKMSLSVYIVEIDSCEYLAGYGNSMSLNTFYLTHKGNCKNHKK